MGADMMLAKMRAPHTDGDSTAKQEQYLLVGHRRIDNFDFTQWSGGALFMLDELMAVRDLPRPDELDEPKLVDYQLGPVTAALHELLDYVLAEHQRDLTTELIGHDYYIFTGGLSIGDVPTDGFDHVWSLDWIDLFDLPITQDELDAVATKEV